MHTKRIFDKHCLASFEALFLFRLYARSDQSDISLSVYKPSYPLGRGISPGLVSGSLRYVPAYFAIVAALKIGVNVNNSLFQPFRLWGSARDVSRSLSFPFIYFLALFPHTTAPWFICVNSKNSFTEENYTYTLWSRVTIGLKLLVRKNFLSPTALMAVSLLLNFQTLMRREE